MRKAEVLCQAQSVWAPIIKEFLQDWPCQVHFRSGSADVRMDADLMLLDPAQASLTLIQKVKAQKQLLPGLRIAALGELTSKDNVWDAVINQDVDLIDFTKAISAVLPVPSSIRLLIADDDAEILAVTADFFGSRHAPAFEVLRAENGARALELFEKKTPDVVILDIKMPLMDGREVYSQIRKQKPDVPVIVFYDAISAGDLNAIRKIGSPVVVEKGYRESSMPYLMALIKKLIYFSS